MKKKERNRKDQKKEDYPNESQNENTFGFNTKNMMK